MTAIQHARMLTKFTCLGDKCPDTCCRGWSMQMDDVTLERYRKEAPELMDAVEPAEEAAWIMRKDKATGYCVKFEEGWCGIHKAKGSRFLGDACYFYPRATRALGNVPVMTATMSCPEIVRLLLEDDTALSMDATEAERLPHDIKNYLPEGITEEHALLVHEAFLAATEDAQASGEHILARIMSVSRSIELIDKNAWAEAVPFYLQNADMRLPQPEMDVTDPFNLLHALSGLIVAARKPMPERLQQTVNCMEKMLSVRLDWQQALIHTDDTSLPAYQKLSHTWKTVSLQYAHVLRRWLAAQLSLALYPFAGMGSNLNERIALIGVRMATVRLALMCAHAERGGMLPQEDIIRVVQSLSRFLDHLGDPAFSLQIYAETGWLREARLRGALSL